MTSSESLILALDVDHPKEAIRLVDQLTHRIRIFKIGSVLFTAAGPSLIHEIQKRGAGVFLDLKFHDIPDTVAGAALQATRLGVRMLTLHTLGGREMMRKTVETVREAALRERIPAPLLLGVTILTSFDQTMPQETLSTPSSVEERVVHLARIAHEAGMDGAVASPHELKILRKDLPPPFRLITPAIRLSSGEYQDQRQVATPRQAIEEGADYIVVGRPILGIEGSDRDCRGDSSRNGAGRMISMRGSGFKPLPSDRRGTLFIETLPTQGESATVLFERLGWKDQAVLFEGMRGGWFDGRFSLLAGTPFAKFQSKEETSRFELLGAGEKYASSQKGNPLRHLQQCLDRFHSPAEELLSEIPFLQGGAAGFFSYDLVRQWERIPAPSFQNPTLPDTLFLFFNLFALLDHATDQLHLVHRPLPEIEMGKSEESAHRVGREKVADLRSRFLSSQTPRGVEPQAFSPTIEGDLSEDEYIEMVLRAKEYIAAGDIFQANLSHRFRVVSSAPSLFQIYRRLRRINPSPFAAYLDLGIAQIASGSPERLVEVSASGGKRFASTRPIAGTHPRGGNETEDQRMIEALYKSEKERAEHLMLVDLERNDLGRVCRYGSIEVDELMSLEKYSHVLHLVSSIQGELRPEVTLTEVVQALFPGGTITGVPKVRCMEILSELEKRARGIYTGAIGYFDFTGKMDLSIAIRTWVRQGEDLSFQVGAGIVADSDPEREYRETLQKAAALIKALETERNGRG